MRIRKNAKLGGGGGSAPLGLDETFQTHVCQLNQSPWDVIPFGSDLPLQFDGEEDSFTGNGSRGDSIGAVESVASMMDAEDQTKPLPKIEDMVVVHDNEVKVLDDIDGRGIADETTSFCQKTDGKNWHCKNEAKQGQSFCEHHLSLLRSYNNGNSGSYSNSNTSSSKKAAAAAAVASAAAGARRAKARAAKRASSSSSSNPYEFYYYSGFGPLWGKRRGDRNGEGNNNHRNSNEQLKGFENSTITEAEEANEETTQNTSPSPSPSSSSSQMDNEEFDYEVDDDEEDEEEDEEDANGDSGKKRMRKPVKARSLKSLM